MQKNPKYQGTMQRTNVCQHGYH